MPSWRAFSVAFALVFSLWARAARAAGGEGEIAIEGGWRLTPNEAFRGAAQAAGWGQGSRSFGGPLVLGAFGYFLTSDWEIGIDLFASGERLSFSGLPPFQSVVYGAAVGVRFFPLGGPTELPFSPFLGLATGPTLVDVSGGGLTAMHETFTASYFLAGGARLRVGERWGLTLEYRWTIARAEVPGVGTASVGGSWLAVGWTYAFPPDPLDRPLGQ